MEKELTGKIQKTIEKEVYPYLHEHGGSVEVVSYDKVKQNLFLRLIGQCCNCPHSVDTVENFIKIKILKHFPNIKKIYVSSGVSDELLDVAKQILRKES